MASFVEEFHEFAMKGNVVDLAVGVVIGAAFGKIVSSLVANPVMPPLNRLTATCGDDFSELTLTAETGGDAQGSPRRHPVVTRNPYLPAEVPSHPA